MNKLAGAVISVVKLQSVPSAKQARLGTALYLSSIPAGLAIIRVPGLRASQARNGPALLACYLFTFLACTFQFVILRASLCFPARTSATAPLSCPLPFSRCQASRFCGRGQTGRYSRKIVRIIWHYVKYFWGQRGAPMAGWLGLARCGFCGSWLASSAGPARWSLFVVALCLFCARSFFCWSFFGCSSVSLGGGLVWVSLCQLICPAACPRLPAQAHC